MQLKRAGKGCWAVLPVKPGRHAKSRLSSLLSPAERQALQQAMILDVLAGLAQSRRLDGIAIISADRQMGELASRHGVLHIPEAPENGDLNASVREAVHQLAAAGADWIAVIAADLPLLQGSELDLALDLAQERKARVVVPDRHREGTTALIFPADSAPDFRFGPASLKRHMTQRDTVATLELALRSMELDLDTPADVACLAAREDFALNAPHTSRVLAPVLARNAGLAGGTS